MKMNCSSGIVVVVVDGWSRAKVRATRWLYRMRQKTRITIRCFGSYQPITKPNSWRPLERHGSVAFWLLTVPAMIGAPTLNTLEVENGLLSEHIPRLFQPAALLHQHDI